MAKTTLDDLAAEVNALSLLVDHLLIARFEGRPHSVAAFKIFSRDFKATLNRAIAAHPDESAPLQALVARLDQHFGRVLKRLQNLQGTSRPKRGSQSRLH